MTLAINPPKFQPWIAKARAPAPVQWVDAASWHGKEPPPREWVIEGLIPKRTVTLLSGDGGVGKSLLAQQMMTACVLGQDFLGMTAMPCRTLGVFCEDEMAELQRRQRSICKSLQIYESDLDGMTLASRVGEDNVLCDFDRRTDEARPSPFYEQIRTRAKMMGAQLVVIDTVADTFGGNENVRPQVRAFVQMLAALARDIDGAIIATAHPSAAGMATGSGYSGSTAWSNTVRSRIYLTRPGEDEEEPDQDVRILKVMKANYGRTGGKMRLKWQEGAFHMLGQNGVIVDSAMKRADLKRLIINGIRWLCERGAIPVMLPASRSFAVRMLWESSLKEYRTGDIRRGLEEALNDGSLVEVEFTRDRVRRVGLRPDDWRYPEEG
jgi:RecA-family ATPase